MIYKKSTPHQRTLLGWLWLQHLTSHQGCQHTSSKFASHPIHEKRGWSRTYIFHNGVRIFLKSQNYITFWKSYKSFKISRKLIPPSASKNRVNLTSKILRLHFVVRTRATLASVCQTGRKWLSSICVPDFGVPWVFEFWPNNFCILNKLSQRTVGQMLSVHTL